MNALAAVYYVAGVVLAALLVISSLRAAEGYAALSHYQSAEEKADTLVKRWLEDLSLGLYAGGTRKAEVVDALASQGIVPGVDLGRFDDAWRKDLLIAVTELHTKQDLDRLLEALRS